MVSSVYEVIRVACHLQVTGSWIRYIYLSSLYIQLHILHIPGEAITILENTTLAMAFLAAA